MGKRRNPSGEFFRRVKAYSEPAPIAEVEPALEKIPLPRRIRDSGFWLLAEVIAFAAVGATLWHIWIDLEDRQTQRIAQAWQLLTQPAPGNSGKGPALEYLNSQGIELVGIDQSTGENQVGSFMSGVNLSGANLRMANLSRANLRDANLSEASLSGANLSGAGLFGANLSGARLVGANLSGAILRMANLSGADFRGADLDDADLLQADLDDAYLDDADLSGANLQFADLLSAKGLLQGQLDAACGNEKTQLPEGFTIKACLEK